MERTIKRRKRRPSIAQMQERMAREGDVEGLWQVLVGTNWTMLNQPEVFGLLLRAVGVAARRDPDAFSEALFARLTGLTTYLVLRAHFYVQTLFAQGDEATRTRGSLRVPPEVLEMLPRLMELQQHAAALAECQARTARLWGLARKGRRGADAVEGVVEVLARDAEGPPGVLTADPPPGETVLRPFAAPPAVEPLTPHDVPEAGDDRPAAAGA
jgi:hypothetical protein